jgi:fibronectin-binding autotransporter adhesin
MKTTFKLNAFLTLLTISSASAGQIWDGTGVDDSWNTAANWDSDLLPTFTNAITFTGNTRNGAVNNLTADSIIGGINLANDGSIGLTNAFTLSGNRITLGGNIVTTASSSAITDIISLNMILNGNRTITTNANHNLSISGIISQSSASQLIKTGTGILTLSAANTFNGGVDIQNGTVRAGANPGASSSIFGGGTVSIANLSTALIDANGFDIRMERLNGGGASGGNVSLGSNTLTMGNASGTYSGIISGTLGNVTYGGSNTATMSGAHSYTGVTTLGGTVGLLVSTMADGGTNSGIGASSSAASNLVFNGSGANASVRYNSASAASSNRQFTLQANGGFGVYGTGALNLTSSAAISHGTGVAAKTLLLAGNGAGGGTMAAQITDSGTGANITGINLGFSNGANSGANWSLTNANNTFTGTILHSATSYAGGMFSYASAGGTNAITFNQTTGSGGISYIGATNKTMSGAITASALTSGTITFDSSGAGAVNYSNTASMGSAGSLNKNIILSGTNTGNNILAAGWNNNTGGAATVTKNGASRWTLSGTNNYTGTTVVNGGTLQFARTVSLYNDTSGSWTAANINVKSGATFAVNVDSAGSNGFDSTDLNTLIGNISVANTAAQGLQSGATLGFDTSTATGGTFTQGNAIANSTGANGGTIGLTKLGTGSLVLDKTNTYTGATNVNAGTLAVNGSITSAVIVASGATLQGSGTITGTVSISGGGAFAAGNSIESLASGNLTLAAAAIFAYEMNNDAAAGVAGDLADVTGNFNLDLGNASILTLTELGTGSWTAGEKLTLVSYTGSWNGGLFNYGGSTLLDDSTISFNGVNWTFNYNDASAGTNYAGETTGAVGFVTMTVIPEPRTALLGALGVLLLLRRRR